MLTPEEFHASLVTELDQNPKHLPADQLYTLRRYYKNIVTQTDKRPFYAYNWSRRVEPLFNALQEMPTDGHMLDAGCGVGTESFFAASVRSDIQISAVDFHDERLAAARIRVPEQKQITFKQANIFNELAENHFDLVWTMEALSHIDPAEKFIADSFEALRPGGKLVVSDSHILNPKMMWRIFKIRRKASFQGYAFERELSTGEKITYANERLFTTNQLGKILKDAGFSHVDFQLSVFFPPSFAKVRPVFNLAVQGDKLANQLPLLRQLGGIYTVSAQK
ncbi:MAG: class I SAM-dependent methyltransferase [Chloroflexota bacterium]